MPIHLRKSCKRGAKVGKSNQVKKFAKSVLGLSAKEIEKMLQERGSSFSKNEQYRKWQQKTEQHKRKNCYCISWVYFTTHYW
jgi:hypothetical protein